MKIPYRKGSCILIALAMVGCSTVDNPCNSQGDGHCASVTTAYNNSLKDKVQPTDLPKGQSVPSNGSNGGSGDDSDLVRAYNQQVSYSQVPVAGVGLRTAPRTMRVWILPYEDDVGLYHDQQYVYAVIDKGNWRYKSISLKDNTLNSYQAITPASGNVAGSDFKPFAAPLKESDPIGANQNAFSTMSSKNTSVLSGIMPTPQAAGN